jgi:hypothetical protein
VPRFLERDEGVRELPYEKYPWDGVSGVKPYRGFAATTTVGVYRRGNITGEPMPTTTKHRPRRGYQFIVDEQGKPMAVVLDLKKHGRLWEDFQDILVSRERRTEPRLSLKEVDARLRRAGKLK